MPLGRSRLRIPAITFGSMAPGNVGHGDQERIETIRAAIDAGITAIDTAPLYEFGRTEEIVGRAIRGLREEVQILTKVGLRWDDTHGEILFRGRSPDGGMREVRRDSRPESVRLEVERSLDRLGVERLDLVQVHHRDRTTPIADTMGALLRLRSGGKLAEIGVSNFTANELVEAASALDDVPLASIQSHYNLIMREVEEEVLPAASKASIGLLCYSPLQQSLLAGRALAQTPAAGDPRRNHWTFHPRNVRLVSEALRRTVMPIALRHQATLAQIALAWLLAQPGVASVIVGATSREQVGENAHVPALELTEAEVRGIRSAFEAIQLDQSAGPSSAQRLLRRVRSRLGRIRRRLL